MTGPPLSYVDEAVLLLAEGAGQEAVLQVLWTYDRPVDLVGLQRSRDALNRSLVSRTIERSPIPFCRSRWVRSPGPGPDIAVSDARVSRDAIFEWADEQVALPLDPIRGPGWQLSVADLTDGGSVVSVVASHAIVDGWGLTEALCRAFQDADTPQGEQLQAYPLRGARRRGRAAREDLRQLVSDVPETARALRSAAGLIGSISRTPRRRATGRKASTGRSAPSTDMASFTTVAAYLDAHRLTERAKQESGTATSLLAAFTIRLAETLERSTNREVNLLVPILDDVVATDRANSVTLARFPVSVDDAHDQLELRAKMRRGIASARAGGDPMLDLLPLVPFVPRRAARRLRDGAIATATSLAVNFSHMGSLPDSIMFPDGSPAERVVSRGVDRNVSVEDLEERGGALSVISAFVGPNAIVAVVSFQPGAANSRRELRDAMESAFSDLALSATYL